MFERKKISGILFQNATHAYLDARHDIPCEAAHEALHHINLALDVQFSDREEANGTMRRLKVAFGTEFKRSLVEAIQQEAMQYE